MYLHQVNAIDLGHDIVADETHGLGGLGAPLALQTATKENIGSIH